MMMMDYLPWMNNEVFNICGQHYIYICVRYACVIHITRSGGYYDIHTNICTHIYDTKV